MGSLSRSPVSAGRSCSSTSGRTRASTACARFPTSRPGTARTARPGSRSSASTAPSSRSSVCPTTSARPYVALAFATRSRSTTTSRTWRAYSNDYWPSKYLIDKSGRIRYEHYGEGAYGETESVDPAASRREGEGTPHVRRRRDAERHHHARVLPRLRQDRELREPPPDRVRRGGRLPVPGAGCSAPTSSRMRGKLDGRAVADRRGARRSTPAQLPGERHLPRARRLGSGGRARRRSARSRRSVSPGRRACTRSRGTQSSHAVFSSFAFEPGLEGYAFTFG